MLDFLARRGGSIAVIALLLATYVALGVSAVLAQPIGFVVALCCAAVIDLLVERRFAPVVALFRRAQFGITHRAVVQVFLMLLLIAITDANRDMSRADLLLVTAAALTVPAARVVYMGLLTLVRRRSLLPVETRNLDLPDEFKPVKLPRVLDAHASQLLLLLSVPVIATGAVAVWRDAFWIFGTAIACYLALVAAASGVLLHKLRLLGARPERERVIERVSEKLGEYRPEVLLYFSGSPSWLYQVEMWIPTLERMRRRTAILVRGRHAVRNLAKTNLPVVCIPSSVDLMNFPLPDARIALYVVNVGNNIHFLREPRVKHVFIGHGDSDKVASFNPFSKAYDEVWVAGRAGRERYSRAKVGVRDEDIVEVGLPPLDDLERRPGKVPTPTPERPLTVLYLPTWEGWTDDGFQTSLTEMGVPLVEKLLASPLPIRILYKPHPMTGTRDPRAAAADQQIRARLAAEIERQPAVAESMTAELEALTERLADPDITADEERALEAEWSKLFWQANALRHVVVTGKTPPLFDLYNAADIMVSDVSSVVSDFMATGKPYIVANPKGIPDDDYRAEFPSVKAAYLLHPECSDLEQITGEILDGDPMSDLRDRERAYLLGPDEPRAQVRWDNAVEALIARADEEWDGEHGAGPAAGPVDEVETSEGVPGVTPVEGVEGVEGTAGPEQPGTTPTEPR
ncbi:MAG TPA: CDP-glycerol glycerophosphotransferase family protein [Actinopolymorphaceae bacterium]